MKPSVASSLRGFSLLELMVSLGIFGVLMALALPGIRTWRTEVRLKEQAESVVAGLKLARGEAIRRNAAVRFQLVPNFTAACGATANSNHWTVGFGIPACDRVESMTFACDPAAANSPCNDPYAPAANSILLKTSIPVPAAENALTTAIAVPARTIPVTTVQTALTVTAQGAVPSNVLCFYGDGQLNRTTIADGRCSRSLNPVTTALMTARFDISDPGVGVCRHLATADDIAADRVLRCQRVEISGAGDVRQCDPWVIHDANAAPDFADPRQCTCQRGVATDQRACP